MAHTSMSLPGAACARCRARDFDWHRSSRRRNNCGVYRCREERVSTGDVANGALKRHNSIVDIRKMKCENY
jgi:hypothetical protein